MVGAVTVYFGGEGAQGNRGVHATISHRGLWVDKFF